MPLQNGLAGRSAGRKWIRTLCAGRLSTRKLGFAGGSPLERDGFERSVPREIGLWSWLASPLPGKVHVQCPAYLSERFPTEMPTTAVAFCFHQGAIWGGLISPLLILYPTTHQIDLSGSDPRHHSVGLGHLPRRGAVEPGDERQGTRRRPDRCLKLPFKGPRRLGTALSGGPR